MFQLRARATPSRPAQYETDAAGEWRPISWQQLYRQAAAVAQGLAALGLEAGERLAILGPTHGDWTRYDLGGHLAGLVTVGVYPRARRQLDGTPVPWLLRLQDALARRLVFKKIQAAFGGRVRACITGAAPIAYDIEAFLWAVGMPVFEACGMTEATVVTQANRDGAVRLGTVGKVIPPMEARIAGDGEVLLAARSSSAAT